jgi:hypothetical protein
MSNQEHQEDEVATKPGLIRSGILFLDVTYATCSVGLHVTL